MTKEEVQELIDSVDFATSMFSGEVKYHLRVVSNLLVDLPNEVVGQLEWRDDEEGGDEDE